MVNVNQRILLISRRELHLLRIDFTVSVSIINASTLLSIGICAIFIPETFVALTRINIWHLSATFGSIHVVFLAQPEVDGATVHIVELCAAPVAENAKLVSQVARLVNPESGHLV